MGRGTPNLVGETGRRIALKRQRPNGHPGSTPGQGTTTKGGHINTLSSHQRGYGHKHQQARKNLLYNHIDGTECDYCGKPMYRDPHKNFDNAPLNADHINTDKTKRAARLLHDQCNKKMNTRDRWVTHGPEWYAKHGQPHTPGDTLDWVGGTPITW